MKKKAIWKRILSSALAAFMVFQTIPVSAFAEEAAEYYDGMEVTVALGEGQPADIDGFVWVAGFRSECSDSLLHSHTDDCYTLICDHKDGHLSSCYSTSTEYTLCTHESDSEHSGSVDLADVVTISGVSVSWKKEHPAYEAVYEVYKTAYEEAYQSAKWGKDYAGKLAGVAAVADKTFCYTTTPGTEPDLCTHVHSEIGGDCYRFKNILEGGCNGLSHEHSMECQYEKYILYADINHNGTPDQDDPSYTIRYVDGETVLQESTHLVDTAYPEYAGELPVKEANAQYTYTFAGWDGEMPDTVTADAVHTAQFTEIVNTYTVLWKKEGAVIEIDEEVPYGTAVSYDGEIPEKEPTEDTVYIFAGWSPLVTEATTVTGNMEFEAVFSDKSVFTIIYHIEGASATSYVIEGDKAEIYAPTREYYTLNGWYTDADCETEFDFETAIMESQELFGSWIPVNDVNEDGIADEEQVREIIVTGEVTAVFSGNNIPGETIELTVTPAEGRYLTGNFTVNGEAYTGEITYSETAAIFDYTLPSADEETGLSYEFEMATAEAAVSLHSEFVSWNELMTAEEAVEAIFENADFGGMPETVAEATAVEYLEADYLLGKNWAEIGTEELTALVGHAYGEKETETIRFVFSGNDRVPAFTNEFTVSLQDRRLASKLLVNETVTFTYSPDVTEEEMAQAIFEQGFTAAVSEDETVTLDAVYGENVFVNEAPVNAGTYTITMEFIGTGSYAAASAEVTVIIEKAEAEVKVSSAKVKYGTEINVSDLINTGAAKRMEIAVGVSMGEYAAEDAAAVAYLNLPMVIDTGSLPENVKTVVDGLLAEITSRELTIAELRSYLLEIVSIAEDAEALGNAFGFELGLDLTAINNLTSALESIEKIEGVGELKLQVSFGETLTLTNAGVYLVGAVVSDENYHTAFGVNYAVITPDGYKAELAWNREDTNGILTRNAILNGFDFGASVVTVSEGTAEEAQEMLTLFFVGVDANGETTITDDPSELQFGVYTQVAMLTDAGNTMYYAEPLVRVLTIVPQIATVAIENKEAVYNGEAHPVNVSVVLEDDSEPDENALTVIYTGISANGEAYHSEEAPVNAGIYTVHAFYAAKAEGIYEYAGCAEGLLKIVPAAAKISVEDAYVIYDGTEHMPEIINEDQLDLIKVIVDENKNINVIFPEYFAFETKTIKMEELADELKMSEILAKYGADTAAAKLAEILNAMEAEKLTINGALPVEDGVYTVTVIGYRANYQTATAEGTLEIHKHTPGEAVKENNVDSDCENSGSCEYAVYCEECGEELSRVFEEIPALGHTWKEATTEIPKTCETCGATEGDPVPTPEPTEEPTPEPTEEPTPEPTEEPTPEPTEEPTPEPTEEPTPEPTPEPTEEPTPEPTEEPTPEPTEEPTPEPTEEPTPEPTEEPTPEPTEEPTPTPTETPEIKLSVMDIFDDVYDDWYLDYVQYVYDHGLMTGIKGTREFRPNAGITKAQVAQVLYNMEGQPSVELENAKVFDELGDVYCAEWYASAVAWAYDTGVITGDLNEMKFFPDADVTREQFALMMFRYAKYKEYDITAASDFAGLENADKVANWSLEGVSWAVGAGLISGIETNGVKDLAPQGISTRAQAAAVLQRFCEYVK